MNDRPRHPTSAPRGFTLVELVVTLIIIGLISMITVPRYASSTERYRVDAAAKRVMAYLELARSTARSRGENVGVTFDAAAGLYVIPKIPSPTDPNAGTTDELDEPPLRAGVMAISFNGSPTIVFDGYGMPSVDEWVMISAGSQVRGVLVDGSSGDVTVAPEGWTP